MKKFIKVIKYTLLFLITIALSWLIYFKVYGNFHKVDDNLYRSAQLYSFNMPYYIKKYHIKSMINFRGKSKWYNDELKICKEYNVTHYDFSFGDRELLPVKRMNQLIALMKKAPKPLLIHCKAGADRTSLTAALYLYKIKHLSASKAENEGISIKYGHFPWLGSKTKAMDESFDIYVKQNKRQK
jgi:protein tyrosine/serine phosphatase